ncbi:MAG: class I SAM-dependent methyltransferase [Acidimicrobiia bacterium]|nr:class I SAM-dependent methyltransferase [Acidimicrobiia bacterium]
MTEDATLDAQRRLWTLGDYSAVAKHLQAISEELVSAMAITAGDDVLDVAVGDGNAAILAARGGASVTGVDLTPAQLDLARARCAAEGVDVELREGNAEALPFPDASFDVVVSSMGLIFAPDHEAAAAEVARVLRPRGRVGITAWADEGWADRLWERAAELLPPPNPSAPKPDDWGDPSTAVARFAAAGIEATADVRPFWWQLPSEAAAAAFFEQAAGPFIALFQRAETNGTADQLRSAVLEAVHEANEATDGTCRLSAPFVLVTGRGNEGLGPRG